MGRVFIDGFECGHVRCWDGRSHADRVYVVHKNDIGDYVGCGAPIRGDFAVVLRSNCYLSLNVSKYLVSPTNELYFKFRYAYDTFQYGDTDKFMFSIWNTSGYLNLYLRFRTSTKTIEIVRGSDVAVSPLGTELALGSTVLSPHTWYLIEFYAKIADAGAYELRINGVTDVSGSADTMQQTIGNIGSVRLHNASVFTVTGSNDVLYDDFAIDDSEWCSDSRIIAMVPNAEGDESDWDWVNKGSDTESWEAVDERPTDNVDYWHTNTVGNLHSVHLEPAPSDPMTLINAVQVCLDSRKSGVPNVQNLEHMLRDNGWGTPNQLCGVDSQLSADANKTLCYCWAQNPGLSIDWLKSHLADLQIGVKAKA